MNPRPEQSTPEAPYTGRFAPSPTGPLHLGSLLAAVASYLDARAHHGKWLVRMEDLDPPREPPGAADEILRQLDALALHWDGEVLFQSTRLEAYAAALQILQAGDLCYACDCTRADIRDMGSVYDGRCRHRTSAPSGDFAVRVKTDAAPVEFTDLVQGRYCQRLSEDTGDFVLLRKDGLFAYQLAVVVDDEFQDISHVIRGYDLLDSTPRQLYLQRLLGAKSPQYGHIPVIVNAEGQKLSKQHFAQPIDSKNGGALLCTTLRALNQSPPAELGHCQPAEILQWGSEHWDIQAVPKLANIPQAMLT